MQFVGALGVGLVLGAGMILLHFQTLDLISRLLPRLRLPHRLWIAAVMFGVFCGHLIEIALFALSFWVVGRGLGLGGFGPDFTHTPLDYFATSAAAFTTLSASGPKTEGGLKLLVSLEGLVGFLLLTWSASFGYTAMKDFWDREQEG